MPLPSEMDNGFQALARAHVTAFLATHMRLGTGMKVLEIGPGDAPLVQAPECEWRTLDIEEGRADYKADITLGTPFRNNQFDVVLAMEVLEHTVEPFAAVREIKRILKDGGVMFASSPFNFRIHGPQPDCWRFTEHGIRILMRDFVGLEIDVLDTPERPLMPIHYAWCARNDKLRHTKPQEVKFRRVER